MSILTVVFARAADSVSRHLWRGNGPTVAIRNCGPRFGIDVSHECHHDHVE